MSIAWSHMGELERVQLLTMKPDLQEDYEEHMGYKVSDTDRDCSPKVVSGVMDTAISED